MSANMTSVRLQILQRMKTVFAAMSVDGSTNDGDAPTSDPYGIQFTAVAIGPLADFDQRKRYSLGIVAGPEKETFQMPFVMCFMTVNVEMRVTVNRDDSSPGEMIEQMITVVKRAIGLNRQWNGLAIDTKVEGTEVDLVTYADRSALAVIQATVQYRYGFADPRTQRAAWGNN